MNRPNLFSTSTLQFPNSIGWWPSRRHLPVVLLALGLFVLSPTAQAQLSPPPDGGYPNGNTAEGEGALFSLTTGVNNTAIGTLALANNRGGNQNTATGYLALSGNTNGANNTANGSHALENNTTGTYNTATGLGALYSNTTGNENTANG